MKTMAKSAVLLSLVENLKKHGSWCGETHVQKATFFLQNLFKVPLDFEYILYKYGPYSFDLDSALTELQANDFLQLGPQPFPYGPSFKPGSAAQQLHETFPNTIKKFHNKIDFIADKFGTKGVAELEQLATALYVTLEKNGSVENRAKQLCTLKPHVDLTDAKRAVDIVDGIMREAKHI